MPFYLDWTYVIVIPAILFSMWASANVNNTFKRYSKVYNTRGLTADAAARYILDRNGLRHIRIERIAGNLTDHFDPTANVIRLSDSVYGSTSAAAVGVACHETGHAIQHAVGYAPIKIRTAIIPATNIGSKLSVPLIIIGLILAQMSQEFLMVSYFGAALFSLCVVFQLVTLPTEFDASKRALRCIEENGLLSGDELGGARKTLRAAAMTYVAALAVSVLQLVRLLAIIGSNRRR